MKEDDSKAVLHNMILLFVEFKDLQHVILFGSTKCYYLEGSIDYKMFCRFDRGLEILVNELGFDNARFDLRKYVSIASYAERGWPHEIPSHWGRGTLSPRHFSRRNLQKYLVMV